MAGFGSKLIFAGHLTVMYAIGVAWETIPLYLVRALISLVPGLLKMCRSVISNGG